jgi:hypothetical protein
VDLCEFEDSQGYTEKSCLKNKQTNKQQQQKKKEERMKERTRRGKQAAQEGMSKTLPRLGMGFSRESGPD